MPVVKFFVCLDIERKSSLINRLIYDSGKESTVTRLLEQDDQIKKLKAKIASLSQDSGNSSKPPSSDGPDKKRYPKKKRPSGRKPGGQKGHKGKKRTVLPAEEMDHIHHLYPAGCEKCGSLLPAGSDSKIIQRHQVAGLFSYRHAFLETESVTREELRPATALIRGRMKRLCNHYMTSEDASVRTRAKRFLKIWEYLFVFLLHDGVEPTNNVAERALRPAVQWRKICFGSKSEKGERFTERILTITSTCRMQGRNPFEYLTGLVTASFGNKPLPSLLPQPISC